MMAAISPITVPVKIDMKPPKGLLYRSQFPDNSTHTLMLTMIDSSTAYIQGDWRINYSFDGNISWIDEFYGGKILKAYPISSILSIQFNKKPF